MLGDAINIAARLMCAWKERVKKLGSQHEQDLKFTPGVLCDSETYDLWALVEKYNASSARTQGGGGGGSSGRGVLIDGSSAAAITLPGSPRYSTLSHTQIYCKSGA